MGPQDISWNHRLTVTVPMSALGIIDSLVCVLTLGFIHTNLGLDWAMYRSIRLSRKKRAKTEKPDDHLAQGICSCGNDFGDDNLCMLSACQWEE